VHVGKNFDPIEPGETDVFSFDFTFELSDGETITGTSWTCALSKGSDALPASRLSGAAQVTNPVINGSERTCSSQLVSDMQNENTYLLEATVETSTGRVLKRCAYVRCIDPK
jgi:hypothetical protein